MSEGMPDNADPPGEQLVFGIPARELVAALRGGGMADEHIVTVVGRAIATSAGLAAVATATAPFVFHTQVAATAPECELKFKRKFIHPDFIDGVTVVQGGATPEEIGFNQRFHIIESDLDNVAHDLLTASNCMAEMRRELFGVVQELQLKITAIDSRLDAKTKDKEKDTKESKDKDTKDVKEKDTKDVKEGKESKDKESKDGKEGKDKDRKEKDKEGQKDGHGKEQEDLSGISPQGFTQHEPSGQAAEPDEDEGEERTFIRLEDRPEVGRAALAESDVDAPGGDG